MPLPIKQGLFTFDCTDYHAILGVSINASFDEVRDRYKQLARILHPDTSSLKNKEDKERAVQIFAKWVSPAYSELSKAKKRAEHLLLLKRIAKLMAVEKMRLDVQSEAAKQLIYVSDDLEKRYSELLHDLTENQYTFLDEIVKTIAAISELNLVYLLYQEKNIPQYNLPANNEKNYRVTSQPEKELKPTALVESYIRRAAGYMMKNEFSKAVLELREALKIDPNNSSCHSLIGMAYLKQNQITMAKIHISKALTLDPQEARALQGQKILEQLPQKASGSKKITPSASHQTKPSDSSGGGLFGKWFGGNKK